MKLQHHEIIFCILPLTYHYLLLYPCICWRICGVTGVTFVTFCDSLAQPLPGEKHAVARTAQAKASNRYSINFNVSYQGKKYQSWGYTRGSEYRYAFKSSTYVMLTKYV
jgi:hypothetical protein